jgi:hypothetical protein
VRSDGYMSGDCVLCSMLCYEGGEQKERSADCAVEGLIRYKENVGWSGSGSKRWYYNKKVGGKYTTERG